jgi:hypothetical protein
LSLSPPLGGSWTTCLAAGCRANVFPFWSSRPIGEWEYAYQNVHTANGMGAKKRFGMEGNVGGRREIGVGKGDGNGVQILEGKTFLGGEADGRWGQ